MGQAAPSLSAPDSSGGHGGDRRRRRPWPNSAGPHKGPLCPGEKVRGRRGAGGRGRGGANRPGSWAGGRSARSQPRSAPRCGEVAARPGTRPQGGPTFRAVASSRHCPLSLAARLRAHRPASCSGNAARSPEVGKGARSPARAGWGWPLAGRRAQRPQLSCTQAGSPRAARSISMKQPDADEHPGSSWE